MSLELGLAPGLVRLVGPRLVVQLALALPLGRLVLLPGQRPGLEQLVVLWAGWPWQPGLELALALVLALVLALLPQLLLAPPARQSSTVRRRQ